MTTPKDICSCPLGTLKDGKVVPAYVDPGCPIHGCTCHTVPVMPFPDIAVDPKCPTHGTSMGIPGTKPTLPTPPDQELEEIFVRNGFGAREEDKPHQAKLMADLQAYTTRLQREELEQFVDFEEHELGDLKAAIKYRLDTLKLNPKDNT